MPPGARRSWDAVDGVLLLDKPLGMSSNGALQAARRLLNAAKAGHTGTLDPLATGLLPLCFGEATKFSQTLLDADKCYEATFLLGVTTTTGDAEGDVIAQEAVRCSEKDVLTAVSRFRGWVEQVPPMFSALKQGGRALYEYARQGVEVERKPRKVCIHEIDVLNCDLPRVSIRVRCSKGTYIRTLAEDIGRVLGCGAHLIALRRTAIGALNLGAAVTLERLGAAPSPERLLAPVDTLLGEMPALHLDEDQAQRLLHGRQTHVTALPGAQAEFRVYGPMGFIGVALCRTDGSVVSRRLISTSRFGVESAK